jgi:hypothetical protein
VSTGVAVGTLVRCRGGRSTGGACVFVGVGAAGEAVALAGGRGVRVAGAGATGVDVADGTAWPGTTVTAGLDVGSGAVTGGRCGASPGRPGNPGR